METTRWMGLLVACATAAFACTGPFQEQLDQTRSALKALQDDASRLNGELTALQRVVNEMDRDHTVTTVVPVAATETGREGYDLSFQDGKTVRIEFGRDAADGYSPAIGVRQDADGTWYWTLDGAWMQDGEAPVPVVAADGADGVVPQFKVEDGNWWISADGGGSWEVLASETDMNGFTVFADIDLSDDRTVTLVLQDGTRLSLPRYQPLSLVLDTGSTSRVMAEGEVLPIPFSLEGTVTGTPVVTTGTDGTFFSRIERTGDREGVILVTAPAAWSDGYILVQAYDGGLSTLQTVSFRQRQLTFSGGDIYPVPNRNAERFIPVSANFRARVSVDEASQSWLRILSAVQEIQTGTLPVAVAANPDPTPRIGLIHFCPADNPDFICATITFVQAAADE